MHIQELYKIFLSSNGVSTDTRNLIQNSIFFALKGGNFNGNDFAETAIKNGCSYAIVDEGNFNSDKIIQVENVLLTLQQLANFHRKQFDIPVIGITGSNGKTTSKELIGAVLKTKYEILITEGNLNNHLGVPLTLLKLKSNHQLAVIEMGANKPGDIKELAEIAEPTHAIITNIGAAHIEGFGSLQGVINTKTELYRFIASNQGFVFYNADDEILKNHLPNVQTANYGIHAGQVKGEIISLNPFLNFKWHHENYQSPEINSQLVGNYNLYNFLAAISIGLNFNVDKTAINSALKNYQPTNNRSQVQKTNSNTLIVDCYNANATSMKAAIENFAEMQGANKMAILGDMLELGPISKEVHQNIVDLLQSKNINAVLVGNEFSNTSTSFKKYNSVQELIAENSLSKIENHMILLKGSRGIKLETLINEL